MKGINMKNKKTEKKVRPAQDIGEVAERYDKQIRDLTNAHAMLYRGMVRDRVPLTLVCATMYVVDAALSQNVISAIRELEPGKGLKGKK